jgi:uncharacterized protein YkwD
MAGAPERPDPNDCPFRQSGDFWFESACRSKTQMARTRTSRLLFLFVLAACALIALQSIAHAAPRRARKAECAGAHLVPAPGNLAAIRAAVLCLHNRTRAARGLPRLDPNPRLRDAASRHSDQMVAGGFFSHVTPDGDDIGDRIGRTGYGGNGAYSLAENLGAGTGELSTPAEIHQAWMESPGHRANLLRRDLRDIGIGVALGMPGAGADGATYTVDFGVRR